MSGRVLIRQGGADSAGTTDFNVFTGNKGAASFDHPGTALISGGMRWAGGEASAATFKILDPAGLNPQADLSFNIQEHALVTFTEDAAGCAYWWHRGRVSGPIMGGRGNALAANRVEFDATSDDGNVELKGQAFTEAWVRPAETDYQRLVALQAYMLNGSLSSSPHHRNTCQVTVLDSHFCKNANTVTMPATTYPIGTQPLDVVADCGTTAGKDYGIVIHHAPAGGALGLTTTLTWDGAVGTYQIAAAATTNSVAETVGTPVTGDQPGTGAEGTTYFDRVTIDGGFPNAAATGFPKASPGDTIRVSGYIWPYWNEFSGTYGQFAIVWTAGSSADIGYEGIGELIVGSSGTPGPWQHFDGTTGPAPTGTVGYRFVVLPCTSAGISYTAGVPGVGRTYWRDQLRFYGPTSSGGDCSHLCLQYIVPTDTTTNPCTVKISDQRADIDEDTATPPTTYAPRWLDGKATAADGQDQLSALVYTYQTATGSGAIFTQNTSDVTNYDYWCEAVSDTQVETPAAAAIRAPAILETRRRTHLTHKVSIPVAADQLHLVEAGMAIQIKAAAALAGQYLGTYQTRRIVQTLKEPRNDGTYLVHMELNRPQRIVPGGGNIGAATGQPSKATAIDPTVAGGTTTDTIQNILNHLQAEIGASGSFLTAVGGEKATVKTVSAAGSAYAPDMALGNVHEITLNSATCAIGLPLGATAGKECEIAVIVHQDATGGRALTFNAGILWPGGTAPTFPTTANSVSGFGLMTTDGGTTVYGIPGPGTSTDTDLVPMTVYNGTNWLPLVDGSGNQIMA